MLNMRNKAGNGVKAGLTGVAAIACAVFPDMRAEAQAPQSCTLAISGVTVIDGTGSAPLRNATVTVGGERILAVGGSRDIDATGCVSRIDGRGKFLTPGFIDTNVHVTMLNWQIDYARYYDRLVDIAVEGAQLHLKYGVTTIRDSYGLIEPLTAAREAIRNGDSIGADIYFAGNIVGWGGHFSKTFRGRPPESYFEEWMNDRFTRGAGEDLGWKSPDELRAAMDAYVDLGVDFVKVGLSDHDHNVPKLAFSERQLKAIVDAVHARGLPVEVHATTPEALIMALDAGVDLIQHPEVMGVPITEEALARLDEGKAICSIHGNNHAGRAWRMVLAAKSGKDKEGGSDKAENDEFPVDPLLRNWSDPEPTGTAKQKELAERNPYTFRENAVKIIKTNCPLTTATDNAAGGAPEFLRTPNEWRQRQHGLGTIAAIEALVELGATPGEAIVAATRNGAIALRRQDELGAIEAGKLADMVMLDADPLKNISNIRRISAVIKRGAVVDRDSLPDNPVYYRPETPQ